jgi:two-component sensor histidine kinase
MDGGAPRLMRAAWRASSADVFDQEDIMTEFADQRHWPDEHVLLHEVNHRITNEFAAAISVVSLTAARSGNDEVKAALSGVTELLHQYADVHRALQMPEYDTLVDAAAYLGQLCRSISRAQLDSRRIRLVLAAQPLRLPADRCWRLGMIVFELINNAARHAFSGGAAGAGEIRVELSRAGALAKCSVADDGSSATTVRPGRGLTIIEALSESLGGRFEQKFAPSGSWSIVMFPCDGDLQAIARKGPQSGVARSSRDVPRLDVRSDAAA